VAKQELDELVAKLAKDAERPGLPGLNDIQRRLDWIARQRARPGITAEEAEALDTLAEETREVADLRKEVAQRTSYIEHLGSVATPAELEKLNQAASRINKLLRRYGENYAKLSRIKVDQVMGEERWAAHKAKLKADGKSEPELENEHIFAVDRITKLPQTTDLLSRYAKGTAAEQEAIVEKLRQIGDRPYNLKRMQAGPNNLKRARPWGEVSLGEVQKFGYIQADLVDLATAEAEAQAKIIEELLEQ